MYALTAVRVTNEKLLQTHQAIFNNNIDQIVYLKYDFHFDLLTKEFGSDYIFYIYNRDIYCYA